MPNLPSCASSDAAKVAQLGSGALCGAGEELISPSCGTHFSDRPPTCGSLRLETHCAGRGRGLRSPLALCGASRPRRELPARTAPQSRRQRISTRQVAFRAAPHNRATRRNHPGCPAQHDARPAKTPRSSTQRAKSFRAGPHTMEDDPVLLGCVGQCDARCRYVLATAGSQSR
jgi:hypothetical protein